MTTPPLSYTLTAAAARANLTGANLRGALGADA